MSQAAAWWRRAERSLLIVGFTFMAAYAAAWMDSQISSHFAIQKFEAAKAYPGSSESVHLQSNGSVDVTLWSPQRIREFRESESLIGRESPLAVLRIPRLRLEVPVFDGTDELTLNRGIGRIIGTTKLGEFGNTGLAGHRDGFFRGLKDIGPGDIVELTIPGRSDQYVVTDIQITTPEDVSVLQPTATASLTLVTCYPFYFVGSAPQRYIVRASKHEAGDSTQALSSAQEIP